MKEAVIRKRLLELCQTVATPTRAEKATESGSGIYVAATSGEPSLEESLDCLRLQVKYLLFDLEASRRENGYLRQMLENRRNQDDDTDQKPRHW